MPRLTATIRFAAIAWMAILSTTGGVDARQEPGGHDKPPVISAISERVRRASTSGRSRAP